MSEASDSERYDEGQESPSEIGGAAPHSFTSRAQATALRDMPGLMEFVGAQVGKRDWASILEEIRRSMLMEGLRQSHGNITRAAEFLGLTRQAVQQMITSLSLRQWVTELRMMPARESKAPGCMGRCSGAAPARSLRSTRPRLPTP